MWNKIPWVHHFDHDICMHPHQIQIIVWIQLPHHTSVACVVGPSVTMSSIEFSFQNLTFWNLFEFSAAEII